MSKTNCWEFKKCGREPGGAKVAEFGVCTAAVEHRLDGVNGGSMGGRSCWAITGTLCGDQIQGSFARKLGSCMACEFYSSVRQEEKTSLTGSPAIIARLA